ncbi:YaaL family protein [Ligilactobacillus ceti]|uniref:DUF2508 domain-containing protein n=1 Tax=Ligilactobacillus ceti DSM 22408 TaxID=1122146 RepID=A0A0R2KGI4_9LACO|nr:YaaL family protein [Ligilactobacillus ceti]KRN88479.1 hypothetical protein IV53_GL000443 [Ligilactobacillus ceti DSM 22408]
MFFNKKKHKLRKKYDEQLLKDIDQAKVQWDNAKKTEMNVYEIDDELIAETQLAKAKYHFLYLEAKKRKLRGRMQSSIISR